MTDLRDPIALARYAVQVGDWRLLELVVRALEGRALLRTRPAGARAYVTLVLLLGLASPANYDRN
jgi:hypothetical protein